MRGKIGVLSVLVGVLCFGSVVSAGQQVLEISPRYLEFTANEGGADPNAQVVSIWNSGNGPMDWTVTPDYNGLAWLTVEPNSGTSSGEMDDINITVDINGLSGGTYDCQLTVTGSGAPNSPQVVDVNLVVYGPALDLSETYFEFTAYEGGANPNDQILSISNGDTGTLNWVITEDCNWLAVEPNSGSSTGEADDVNLSVDITGLGVGRYNCQLTVSDSNALNSPQVVDVNLIVIGPLIGLSATVFNFNADEGGSNPAAQVLSITNTGGATLNWVITEDCNWLSVEPNIGSSNGEADDVNLSVDITGLVGGIYNCQLTVYDPNASNSPQFVDVNLVVIGPIIDVSATQLEFTAYEGAGNPNDQILSITNIGGGTLNWEVTEDCNWLTVEPNSGSGTGEVDEVNLSVDITGLVGGIYNCQLTVSDPNASNSPQIVDVNLVVVGPVIGLSSTQIQFFAFEGGANPNVQVLGISNIGGGTLNWEAAEDCNWLALEPNSGSSTGEVDDVNLIVEISGLGKGMYVCDLTVSDANASNSPQVVSVKLLIGSEAELHVPSEYPTIQAAIDAAVYGNTVIVEPNTYTGAGNKDLDFGGKAITVRSIDPEDPCVVAATVIDCEDSGRGFYFHSGEGRFSVVSGLTITRGRITASPGRGGGIYCSGSSPTIENCVISASGAYGGTGKNAYGGGISCVLSSNPVIVGCSLISNTAKGGNGKFDEWQGGPGGHAYGGGMYFDTNNIGKIIDCTISGSGATGGNGGGSMYGPEGAAGDAYGGGVYCASNSAMQIQVSTVSGNAAIGGYSEYLGGDGFGGGIFLNTGNTGAISECVVSSNLARGSGYESPSAGIGGGVYCLESSPTISGCTISGNKSQQANGSDCDGGGMYFEGGSPVITGCTISSNWSYWGDGGGICLKGGDPTISYCTIKSNRADDMGSDGGGGVCFKNGGNLSMSYCTFISNCGLPNGGGVYCAGGSATISDCVLIGNYGWGGGGGLFRDSTAATITNCILVGNEGEAIWGGPAIENCTIAENYVSTGTCSGIDGSGIISNSIIWGNEGTQIEGSPTVTYSNVEGGWGGEGNIDADPCFVTGPLGDYYLSQVAAGQALNSPCVDAGSDTAAVLGLDEFTTRTDQVEDAGIVDMGYHYRLPEPWDFNGDWTVNFIDFGVLADQWQQAPGVPSADIVPPEGDGIVDGLDLRLLVDYWLWQE